MQLTGAKLSHHLNKTSIKQPSLFPHSITIYDLSKMSKGIKVIWRDNGWQFEGWIKTAVAGATHKVVIAFHGFDRTAKEMENFMPLYDNKTTMLSVSLLHHGKSRPIPPLKIDKILPPEILMEALKNIIKERWGDVECELLGYSMGSRIALKLYENFPSNFYRIIVLAPDGLRMGGLYKFLVNTVIGRFCWGLVDKFPRVNRWCIDSLHKAGLISSHKHHFGRFHTDNHEIRQRVAYGWAGHKRFWPDEKKLSEAFNSSSKIPAYFIFGDRDKIIPYRWSNSLRNKLQGEENVKFKIIDSGHVMRHPETVEKIKSVI
mgnify:CR=1 FL=1